ncbi:MAG: hypothetical protein G01um101433_783, partial [Parcubacteria group bacterium Gr01-1014_33]
NFFYSFSLTLQARYKSGALKRARNFMLKFGIGNTHTLVMSILGIFYSYEHIGYGIHIITPIHK